MSEELQESHGRYLSEIALDLDRRPLITGLSDLDYNEYLLKDRGNLVVVAGRAGNGKTAIAAQIALNVAENKKVLYFSLEMKDWAIGERLISGLSQIPVKKLKEDAYKERLLEAQQRLSNYKLKIIDKDGLSVNQLLGMVYDENRLERVSLVVVDYIGLLSKDNSAQRHLDVREIAHTLKHHADQLKIPFLVVAQMNQGIDSRLANAEVAKAYGKVVKVRPQLSDLGESKGIADSSDVVLFIQRPCLYDPEMPRSLFKVYCCKNRNGPTHDFDLTYSEELTAFFDKKNEEY